VPTDDGNQGRVDVMIAGGFSWKVAGPLSVNAMLKVPVITHVVGGQLDMPAILELGASWSFGSPPRPLPPEEDHDHGHEHDEHEHEHGEHDEHDEHDEHADTTGLDIAELPEPAPGVELAPVPGKMTIIDVWATWCEPCKTLEPVLVDLVRAHPDTLALRRVDVTDSDEWSAKLPHVRVFDASGKKVLEVSSDGDLDALIEAVRAVVEP
jgi:thiol-disulfide isomerase/thioredoxin